MAKRNEIEVCFYAIASKKFIETPEDVVYMKFDLQEYEGLQTPWKGHYEKYVEYKVQTIKITICYVEDLDM